MVLKSKTVVVPSSIVTFPPSADNAISKDALSVSPVDTTDKGASFVIVSAVSTNPSIVKSVVASIVVPVIPPADTVSRLAVPSIYKSFHSKVDEPKSPPASEEGTKCPLAVILPSVSIMNL